MTPLLAECSELRDAFLRRVGVAEREGVPLEPWRGLRMELPGRGVLGDRGGVGLREVEVVEGLGERAGLTGDGVGVERERESWWRDWARSRSAVLAATAEGYWAIGVPSLFGGDDVLRGWKDMAGEVSTGVASCRVFVLEHWAKGRTTKPATATACLVQRMQECKEQRIQVSDGSHVEALEIQHVPSGREQTDGEWLGPFLLVAVQEATRCNRQRRSASRRCIQRHSSAIIACARDSSMHFSAKLSSN